jgi:peptidoglycan/LPS O-acetylase OafA/YrhL
VTGHSVVGPRADAVVGGVGFRSDIQGLRTIAVLLVVIYHIWPHSLTGGYVGVDVFFVISGFLMTVVLLKHPPRRARDFGNFWARRIRRLLPAAFLVIAVTAVATRLLAPSPLWLTTARQSLASTLYVQNWVLAANSVDYLAADDAPSPLLHYWSLSVEEQFYLLWPLVMAAALWWAARRRLGSVHGPVLAATGLVFAASLVASVWYTSVEPAAAYFVTPTRMWELALGGIVAALPAGSTEALPRAARSGVSWLGIAAIVAAGVWYTAGTPFPGYFALLPTVGTALVLWCRPQASWSPDRVLGLRPVQYLGDISYSVYLWHWPIIVLLPYVSGTLGILDKCAALGASIVLAAVTKRAVEDPFRRTRTPRALLNTYRFGGVGMLTLGLAAGVWLYSANAQIAAAAQAAKIAEQNAGRCFGAGSMAEGFAACPQNPSVHPVPAPEAAKQDKAVAYADNCWSYRPFTRHKVCTYGNGPTKVALVGNSHAGHWLPALIELAKDRGWTITTYLVSQCAPSDTRQQFDTPEMSQNCHDYGQWVQDRTGHGQYDLIITSNRESVKALGQQGWAGSEQAAEKGFHTYLQRWAAGGTPVVVIHDLPYPGKHTGNIPDCLAQHVGHVHECDGTPASWQWYYPYAAAADGVAGVHVIDMTRYFCTERTCPAVIGGVTVYFDGSHMTSTYSRTLAPYLGDRLDALDIDRS